MMPKRIIKKFSEMKMLSARIENTDHEKFEELVKWRDRKTMQEFLNLFVQQYISGNLILSGNTFKNK